MVRRLSIVVVASNAAVGMATARRLNERHDAQLTTSAMEAIATLKRGCFDVVVCDQELEPVTAGELFEILSLFFPKVRRVLQVGGACPPRNESTAVLLQDGLAQAVIARGSRVDALSAIVEG